MSMSTIERPAGRRGSRRGTTFSELIVAGTLLIAALGLFARGTLGTSRLWQDTRHHQLALDELANQLDRLAGLPSEQRAAELADLRPSAAVSRQLSGANLTSEFVRDEAGERLILNLQWDRPGGAQPLTLVGWMQAFPSPDTAANGGDES